MFTRIIQTELAEAAKNYPVVTIIGPRQSGKTTLVQQCFGDKPYVNLEHLNVRQLALSDPQGFLDEYPDGAILDEIQRVPDLLSYIQVIVDEKQQKGQFILTGSHQLSLHEAISQSLAGRTAILKLLPLSIMELADAGVSYDVNDYLLKGFYPRVHNDKLNPTKAYSYYYQTYVERDVRQLINLKDVVIFEQFIKLCAGRIGQLLNINNLANELGYSTHTIKHWLSILEASFIIFRLQPFHQNISKRLIKSPKLYFTDVGFATYLLDIENTTQLASHPSRGNLFENMVILEWMKHRYNQGLLPHMYFYRDNHQHEVDLIIQSANQWIPVEIKISKTFTEKFTKGVTYFQQLLPEQVSQGFIIYTGDHTQRIRDLHLLNYKQFVEDVGK
jgi:uncharacterized protein